MPITPDSADFDTLAVDGKAIWMEAAERLKLAVEAESNYRDDAIQDLEFGDGRQWPDDLYNYRKINKRPSLTFNYTDMLVKRVVNNLRAQRPRIKVEAVGQADVEEAKVVEGLIRHIETWSKAGIAYDTGAEFAVRIGWGYWRIVSEYVNKGFEQELKILPVRNPFTVYCDPSATMPDASDMKWCLLSENVKRTQYHLLYPDEPMDEFDKFGPGDMLSRDWQSAEEIRLAEYFRIYETKEPLYRLTTGAGIWADEWERWEERIRGAGFDRQKDERGKAVTRPALRRKVQWYRLNGTRVVDKRELPGEWIPVIRCEGNALDYNGQVRRKGMIRNLKDPARMVNYWETAKTEKLALSPKSPIIMAEGQADGHPEWEDANQKPYSRLEYKPVTGPDGVSVLPPPQRLQAVEVEAGFAEATQGAQRALLAIAGMPHDPGEDKVGSVISGKALRQRQMLSDIGHMQYYDNQTMAIAHTGRILLSQIPFYYGEPGRIQRIVGEDGVPEMTVLNEHVMNPHTSAIEKVRSDMTVGRYDVVMDTGPGYETKRQEAAEAMVDMMRTPLGEVAIKVGPDIIFRNMDWPGADDLANRALPLSPQGFEKAIGAMSDEAKAVAQAMQQQIMQLQNANQQLQMQIKYKSDIEHGWMAVELEKARVSGQTKEVDTHVKAQTALNVAEIGAAGKILDTHAGAAHDLRQAKELAANAVKTEKSNGSGNG